MKIYTKSGDKGETGLLGGVRVSKDHPAISVCGALDETNSWIGLVRSESLPTGMDEGLTRIQKDLFEIGGRVAGCLGSEPHRMGKWNSRTEALEEWIDQIQDELSLLSAFILPGGGRAGSMLHLARSVCRRAERELVAFIQSDLGPDLLDELIFLNRLGDLLFVLARWVNASEGNLETEWIAGQS